MSSSFSDQSFFFGADVSDPLVLEKIELRSEWEYDRDLYPEKTALKYIERISKCFDGHVYLVTASQDVAPASKLRSKKGVLWNSKKLRDLDNRSWRRGQVRICAFLLDKLTHKFGPDPVSHISWKELSGR